MYTLLGIDTVLRISIALILLSIVVPALAWRRPRSVEEWWFSLAAVVVALTLAGQLFTLFHIAGTFTYLTLIAAVVILARARKRRISPLEFIALLYGTAMRIALRLLDHRISIRRRAKRALRRRSFHLSTHSSVLLIVIAVAAAFRFYRPFATANLGFSDTYVHLYLMRLLDAGKQIDPAWGPYPRGMHFLLLAIQRLTNADEILLMNFFGAFSGVLMTLAASYAAKRVTRSNVAALVAGLVFATMIGGAHQYFALGGSVSTDNREEAKAALSKPYADLAGAGEFDVLLTAFERQTSTLPQELAIAFLFPAALFLLDWLRERDRFHLAGFILSTAAIAAIHSGVLIPLVLLCVAVVASSPLSRPSATLSPQGGARELAQDPSPRSRGEGARRADEGRVRAIVKAALAGAIGVALGSTWMIGFLFYRRVVTPGSRVGSTALYYFPFLRTFAGADAPKETAYMMLTPFLIAMFAIAAIIAIRGSRTRDSYAMFAGAAVILFITTHAASIIGIPEIVEVRRNASWLAMSIAIVIGCLPVILSRRSTAKEPSAMSPSASTRPTAVAAALLAAWLITIPNLFSATMRSKLLDYSGYGLTTYAVLKISNEFQPYTWTLVSYGQEYPMVLGRGFHLNGADFLEEFDPTSQLGIPTPYVFIAVEKNAHPFQINNWSTRFDRAAIEERLQTWCTLYRMTHRDMQIWLDDANVRVYAIERMDRRRT